MASMSFSPKLMKPQRARTAKTAVMEAEAQTGLVAGVGPRVDVVMVKLMVFGVVEQFAAGGDDENLGLAGGRVVAQEEFLRYCPVTA